jgi:polysaccharide export outer membrane protein
MRHFFYLTVAILFLSSCRTVKYESIPYFTDLPINGSNNEPIKNLGILKIQKNDILALTVTSLNPEASAIFNIGSTSSSQSSSSGGLNPISSANGFLVDQNGQIQLPLVGSVSVLGLTTGEARLMLEKKLLEYLKEPLLV